MILSCDPQAQTSRRLSRYLGRYLSRYLSRYLKALSSVELSRMVF